MNRPRGLEKDTRDIARGALVNFSGVLIRSISIGFYVFLARVYGPEVVGVFVVCVSGLDIISKLGILGFDRAITTVAARHEASGDESLLYRSVAAGFAMAVGAAALVTLALETAAIPIAARLLDRPDLVEPLSIMAPGVLFWTISAVLLGAARAMRVMKYDVAVKSTLEPTALFALALVFHLLLPGLPGLAWAFVLSTFSGAAAAAILCARRYSVLKLIAALKDRRSWRELFSFAAPIGVYDLLNLLLQRVDLFILTRFAPAAQVGIYGIAQNTAFVFKKIRQSFDPIYLPVISAAREQGRRDDLLTHYRNVTRWILILNLGAMGVALFGARLIMGIFGTDFTTGSVPLVIVTASIMVNTILGVSELFILMDRPAINLANTMAALVVATVLALLLVPPYGMVGAAVSVLGSYALMNTLRLVEVWTIFRLHPFTGFHGKALVAFACSGAAVYALGGVFSGLPAAAADAVAVILFLAGYTGALAMLGLAAEERAVASKILKASGIGGRRGE